MLFDRVTLQQFAARSSQFATRSSQFAARSSQFAVRSSQLAVRSSWSAPIAPASPAGRRSLISVLVDKNEMCGSLPLGGWVGSQQHFSREKHNVINLRNLSPSSRECTSRQGVWLVSSQSEFPLNKVTLGALMSIVNTHLEATVHYLGSFLIPMRCRLNIIALIVGLYLRDIGLKNRR